MILLYGVFAGLVAGLLRAALNRKAFDVPDVRWSLLILAAFLPQLFVFVLPSTRVHVPDAWAPVALVGSQVVLLIWVLLNLKKPMIWLLALGLIMNLGVIVANGGLMPIRPEMVIHLYPDAPASAWAVGERLGVGKDIVLLPEQTRFWFLSDWFTLPDWIPITVAFSFGDVLISLGAFWLLWQSGAVHRIGMENVKHEAKII